jgi:hypothetical protein
MVEAVVEDRLLDIAVIGRRIELAARGSRMSATTTLPIGKCHVLDGTSAIFYKIQFLVRFSTSNCTLRF